MPHQVAASDFAPLRVRSGHTLHQGASSVRSLVAKAARSGSPACALTDENNLCGAMDLYDAARELGVRPVLGARLTGLRTVTLLARDAAGYSTLCRLISERNLSDDPEAFDVARAVGESNDGLFVLVDEVRTLETLSPHVPPERLRAEVVRPAASERTERDLVRTAKRLRVPLVASAEVYFAEPEGFEAHAALVAIGRNAMLDEVRGLLEHRRGAWLRTPAEMRALFADMPEAVTETRSVADECDFDLLGRKAVFPKVAEDGPAQLRAEAEAGARSLYSSLTPEVRHRLETEFDLISRKGFADYFLVVADIVRHARSLGTPVAGRGSGASSLVAYCLGITNVDPIAYRLPFERFLNEGRRDFPDLDIDFCWRLRGEVIRYAFGRFGRGRVAMVSTHTAYRRRGALRESLRVLGVPDGMLSEVARKLEGGLPRERWRTLRVEPETIDRALRIARMIEDSPRCISVHCGGVVMTPDAISNHAPLQRASKLQAEGSSDGDGFDIDPNVVIVQYDKDGVERAGLVKLDLLGNRALSSVAESSRLSGVDPARVPEDEPTTAALVRSGDTIGVNQLESPAMRRLLVQMRSGDARAVMRALALIRPGAAALGMKEVFIRRERALEPTPPIDPRVDGILGETHGVMLYEDDALFVAGALAGLDAAEADRFRRAVTKCRDDAERELLSRDFLLRCRANGVDRAVAADLWVQMAKFNAYSFCRAHAASYARLAWMNAAMKARHPVEFWTAALNNNEGMYSPWLYLEEARREGIRVLPPCANRSGVEFVPEAGAIRAGLSIVKGLSSRTVESVIARRPFEGLEDLLGGVVGPQDAELLIRVGALDFTGCARPELIFDLHSGRRERARADRVAERLAPYGALFDPGRAERDSPQLGDYDAFRKWRDEWELTGLSFRWHPLAPFRRALSATGVSTYAEMRVGRRMRLAGVPAAARRTQTSRGETMLFVTLVDETGVFEATLFPDAWRRARESLSEGLGALIVEGRPEEQYDAVTVVAARAEVMSSWLKRRRRKSA